MNNTHEVQPEDIGPRRRTMDRDALLVDAARELSYPKLTRKVRRALNKASSAENNAGRLHTDWERIWKSKKR